MGRMLSLDRRTFLAGSVALTAGTRLSALPASPDLLVLDRRFTHLGVSSHADVAYIQGDVTALWREHLNDLWRASPASVAGVTDAAALFCLEQLARGHGRKVSMRHPIAGTNAVRWVISPVSSRGFS
jgi:hypothetical protein